MGAHRLVAIGDSLTQGFKSGAIFEPQISYPSIIAWEMGIDEDAFRFPHFSGEGGLPVNIEYLLRKLDGAVGSDLNWWDFPIAAVTLPRWMDRTEDYWERGPGAQPLAYSGPYHNLAVWGFEVQDAYQVDAQMCADTVANPRDNWLPGVPSDAMLRTALRVLNPSHDTSQMGATQLTRAAELAQDGGIENLIVFLGANNVLSSVVSLAAVDSTAADLGEPEPGKRKATVYTAAHFDKLLGELLKRVEQLNGGGGSVDRVFFGTVPPVTIPPVSRGVGGRLDADPGGQSPYGAEDDAKWYRRYFRYYTRPWVPDSKFRPHEDPHLEAAEIIEIDRRILAYKEALTKRVAAHNKKRVDSGDEPDWFIVDLHQLLERVAFRRYQEDPSVPPPPGWTPYEMPAAYEGLNLDTRFLGARQGQRIAGGLFSLDGVHPTTAGYGIVAQEVIWVMQAAGVPFYWGDGATERTEPVTVDFERLLRLDSLVHRLPLTLDDLWEKLVDGDQVLDIFKRAFRALTC